MALREIGTNELLKQEASDREIQDGLLNIIRDVKMMTFAVKGMFHQNYEILSERYQKESSPKLDQMKGLLNLIDAYYNVDEMTLNERAMVFPKYKELLAQLKEQFPTEDFVPLYLLVATLNPIRELVEIVSMNMSVTSTKIELTEGVEECLKGLEYIDYLDIIHKTVFKELLRALNEKLKIIMTEPVLEIAEDFEPSYDLLQNVLQLSQFLAYLIKLGLKIPEKWSERIQKSLIQTYFIPVIPTEEDNNGKLPKMLKMLIAGGKANNLDLPLVELFAERLPVMIKSGKKSKVLDKMRKILIEKSVIPKYGANLEKMEICESITDERTRPLLISERCYAAWELIQENKEFAISMIELYSSIIQKENIRGLTYWSIIFNDCQWLLQGMEDLVSRINFPKLEIFKIPAVSALLSNLSERIWDVKINELKETHEKLLSDKFGLIEEIDHPSVERELSDAVDTFTVAVDADKSVMEIYFSEEQATSIIKQLTLHMMDQLAMKIQLLPNINDEFAKPLTTLIQKMSKAAGFKESKLPSIKLVLESSLEALSVLYEEKQLKLSASELRDLAKARFPTADKRKMLIYEF